ncbi:MAG TPA: cytochrome C oxidase subunit IV family protein [Chitinophagales bacterium]|nr:cytochrome C oxidase subunit IV family protein [Chitinophagales bacterium]
MAHLDDASYNSMVKAVWQATALMAIVTVFEVAFALVHFWYLQDSLPKIYVHVVMIVATLIKAFFIIAEFMHLKYEKRPLIMSLGLPLIFLVWALIALSVEGNYWLKIIH